MAKDAPEFEINNFDPNENMPDPELVMLVDEDNNPVLDNDGKMVGAPR